MREACAPRRVCSYVCRVSNRLVCTALVAAGFVIGCTSVASEEPLSERAVPHQSVEPTLQPVEPVLQPSEPKLDVAASEPAPVPVPEPPSFDPTTATELTVRIVAVHSRGWGVCGIIHSVGAIEVEVLDVGEPPPRMALYISCPSDVGRGGLLDVGEVVRVELFARKQSWPKPNVELPDELVVRYVESIERASRSQAGSATN
jgi:hypothetical protein